MNLSFTSASSQNSGIKRSTDILGLHFKEEPFEQQAEE
jgi:hypothetical protein